MTFARDLANFADVSANNLTFRNLIINGAMQVAQRNTSVAGINTPSYNTADRWESVVLSLGVWTNSVENDAPTGSGFRKSFKMLCTTADTSPAAGDLLLVRQTIEGQNCQAILKGTSSAKQLTVSFWVKANVTGTYIVYLNDNDNARFISASYTISSSATWEKKTVTFAADTSGVLDNDNNGSLRLSFALGAGSDYNSGTLGTSWTTATSTVATGQTNLAAATNNYWQITGVQLEIGSSASAYEFKPIDVELAQCQRYYVRSTGTAYYNHTSGGASLTTRMFGLYVCPVPLRAAPTAIEFANVAAANYGGNLNAITAMSLELTGLDKLLIYGTVASGLSANVPGAILNNNNAAGYIGFSAEL